MKKLLSIASILFLGVGVNAQYYYHDIIGNKQTNQQYKQIQANQLKRVIASSFEPNNQPNKDFVLEQTVANNGQQIITRSSTIGSAESIFTSNYKGGRLSSTKDSSSYAINTVEYQYDGSGKLTATHATSKDFDGTFSSTESHLWSYNEQGQPTKMLKVKNGTDTTVVTFVYDENNNVAEEIWTKNNRTIETYYYYYNKKNQLTDIVKYNRKARQLLPDYIFEYDEQGRLTQMTQTQSTNANYLIYKYVYNDRGLRDKELVYNKQKEYLGRIEYSYQ